MSRTLTEIYEESVKTRNKYLKLTELTNDSNMSIISMFTWVTSAIIYSFETMLDVFMTDISTVFNTRINGTPAYYANAMLKWQYGNDLIVNEEGTSFSYAQEDTTKQIITHVSYQETYNSEYKDNVLILKVATGEGSALQKLTDEQLIAAKAYLNQIKFAGVKCDVVSRNGDILVPKVTVYSDGAVSNDELYNLIDESLTEFINSLKFDSLLYVQQVIDAIQKVEHVVDVYIDPESPDEQGVFIAQYDDGNNLGELQKIERKIYTSSGYVKQSSQKGAESSLPTFRNAIVIKFESSQL